MNLRYVKKYIMFKECYELTLQQWIPAKDHMHQDIINNNGYWQDVPFSYTDSELDSGPEGE